MNNTVLKVIAGLLLIGSLIVAYIGIQLSRQPAAPVPTAVSPARSAPAVPKESVVVAARHIQAGHRITAADLGSRALEQPAPQALRVARDAIGKVALSDIPAGTPLSFQQFAIESLASLLGESERAIAVQVDEVAGVGGYAQPGDRVDVLLFLSGGRQSDERQDSAQVVIQNARLLTLGEANQMDKYREQLEQGQEPSAAPDGMAQVVRKQRQNLRSAVLAIDRQDVTRLMLASTRGQLRLALRPSESLAIRTAPPSLQPSGLADHQFITLSDFERGSTPVRTKPSTASRAIIIQEGSQERPLAKVSPIAPSAQEVGL